MEQKRQCLVRGEWLRVYKLWLHSEGNKLINRRHQAVIRSRVPWEHCHTATVLQLQVNMNTLASTNG